MRDMKKIATMMTALAMTVAANAQSLKTTGNSTKDIVPQGWEVSQATGDLNKDGIADLVVIATPDNKEHMHTRDDGYVYNFNPPILAIYWGQSDGTFSLYQQYTDIIPHSTDEYIFVEVEPSITDRGVIKFSTSSFASAGSWSNGSSTLLFRYQNGDFYLIGYDTHSMARNTGVAETHSYNYLTHKKQVETSNAFDDSVPKREKWSRIPNKPLKKLGSFSFDSHTEN